MSGHPLDHAIRDGWETDALCLRHPRALEAGHWSNEACPSAQAVAKAICGECPVEADCLAWAILNRERWDIWGGYGPAERGELARLVGVKGPRRPGSYS